MRFSRKRQNNTLSPMVSFADGIMTSTEMGLGWLLVVETHSDVETGELVYVADKGRYKSDLPSKVCVKKKKKKFPGTKSILSAVSGDPWRRLDRKGNEVYRPKILHPDDVWWTCE